METRPRLGRHPNYVSGLAPTPDALKPYIDCELVHGHWFFLDRKPTRRHDATGQAMIRVRQFPLDAGVFNVARVLLEHRHGELPPRTAVYSTCGLPQCINPDHWAFAWPAPRYRLDAVPVADGSVWRLVVQKTGAVLDRAAAVLLEIDGVVHRVDALPERPLAAACGTVVDPLHASVVTRAVSCQGCR
jgi:hypothetical protein